MSLPISKDIFQYVRSLFRSSLPCRAGVITNKKVEYPRCALRPSRQANGPFVRDKEAAMAEQKSSKEVIAAIVACNH
jgi:hypothetical protein